jgi:hypothetical protein
MLAPINLLDERAADTAKVWLPNAVTLAFVNGLNLKDWLQVILISLSIAYTLWRWRRESYAFCAGCRDGKVPLVCPLPARRRPWWCPKKL